jgi:hypothetical protein
MKVKKNEYSLCDEESPQVRKTNGPSEKAVARTGVIF